jgi:hypothetical protein
VNVKIVSGPSIGNTPLDLATSKMDDFLPKDKAAKKETSDLLRKHGAKHGEKPAPAPGDEFDVEGK